MNEESIPHTSAVALSESGSSVPGVPTPEANSALPPGTNAPIVSASPRGSIYAPRLRRLAWLVFSLVLMIVALGAAWYGLGEPSLSVPSMSSFDFEEEAEVQPGGISVNTVRPQRKTLKRVLVQPATVRPYAQAELYAKTSGYLRSIQRDPTPEMATALAGHVPVGVGGPLGGLASLAATAQIEFLRAPQKDIGSVVRTGEPLLEIAAPERLQDVTERESVLQQRLAELEQTRTAVGTAEAFVESVKAQQTFAEADVRRAEAEHTFRATELARLRDLARSRTITSEVVDEKQFQVHAAAAALDSSRAKVLAAGSDLAVAESKLATARADLRVKEALVQVASDSVEQARILARYSVLTAPFDGVITQRGIDEGDFVQNSTSGQTRMLMTVSAIDRVKAVLQVPEQDAVWVEIGAPAILDVDARKGWQARGRVARTSHVLDPQSRTLQVEIDLDNRNRRLLPGMYGNATLTLQQIPDAWALPATAVYSRRGSNYVLEVREGFVHRVAVRIYFDDGKEVGVVKLVNGEETPLDGSEELVVSNKGEIADGQRVASRTLAKSD